MDELPLIRIDNLEQARFRCVFPTCDGLCCRTGRPNVTEDDVERIRECLDRVLPRLRPDVRRYLKRHSWLSGRKEHNRTLQVAGGACVFYNNGCVLQQLGME